MVSSTFNIVDIGILLIIGLSLLIGFLRGATREVLGIASWVGSFAIVFYGLPLFRPLGREYIASPMVADAVVALVLFIISLTFFILIGRTISTGVKGSILGGIDRTLGLVFGFVRGLIVICLVYLILGFFYVPEEMPLAVQQARFTPWASEGAHEIKRLIPDDYLPSYDQPAIDPLDPKDLITNSLPSLEDTVKNLATLKPKSLQKSPEQPMDEAPQDLEGLIQSNTDDSAS